MIYRWLIPDNLIPRLDVWVHTGRMNMNRGKIIASQTTLWDTEIAAKKLFPPEIRDVSYLYDDFGNLNSSISDEKT